MDRIKQEDVPQGAPLRMRHRCNPDGAWRELAALGDRPSANYHVEALVGEAWVRVAYKLGGGGGWRPGAGRPPREASASA